jgi:TolB-like protein/AraC-like DNA-binding protein/Tfp pilus assembly protein PilF
MPKEFLYKLTELVEANLANEHFGIELLAKEMGMSHSNLHRKLRSASNQNISQFIREIRLKKAKELLLNEDLTAAEIAYRVGFGSPTYFNKCFHATFGVSPGEFRNREPEIEPEEQTIEAESLPQKSKRNKILIGLMFILIVVIPLSDFLINKISKATIKEKSIAVLPFMNDSPDSTNIYFMNGVTEAITDKLAQIKDLKVKSRNSAERYRNNKTKSTPQIAHELGVKFIVEGSVQKFSDSVLVSVQLIEALKDEHIFAKRYPGKYDNRLNLYSEIAFDVASEIKAIITPEEKHLIRKTPTTNPIAYNFYQRGRDLFDNYNNPIPVENARHLFQKALALDSTFALAWSGLAGVYLYRNYWKTFLSENFLDSVLILTSKALAYDNQCAEAYYFRARRYYEMGKMQECIKEIDKAIKLKPDYWKFYIHRSYFLRKGSNDFVPAISDMLKAMQCSSVEMLPNLMIDLGMALTFIGFPEQGKHYFQQSLELSGDSSQYLYWFIYTEYSQGNFKNAYLLAKNAYQKDSRLIPDMPHYCLMAGRDEEACYYSEKLAKLLKKTGEVDLSASMSASLAIGYSYWKAGRTKEAEYYFNRQIEIDLESIRLGRWNSMNKRAQFDLAKVFALKGEKEKAYQYLDEVNKNQVFPLWWVIQFKCNPLLNRLRQEPRFQKILKDVEGKYHVEHERTMKWLVSQGIM